MTLQEQAQIIALARTCDATGTDKEILDKYTEYYQAALKSLSSESKPATVKVSKRLF